ncbi:hypothetical protein A6A06_01835 [Streptomyces sp. CB02923]|nr:hypothetical protein A6A06_01835 [Streptomyces sp. CB02923]
MQYSEELIYDAAITETIVQRGRGMQSSVCLPLRKWRETVEIRLLGTVEVLGDDGGILPIQAPMLRTTLAALALRAGRVVPTEELADQLWGVKTPATARVTLRNHIKRLRKILPAGRIHTESGGYRLAAELYEIDVERFRRMLLLSRKLSREALREAADTLDEALVLWRGTPLTDLVDSPLRVFEQPRLEDIYLTAVEERFALGLDLGDHEKIVDEIMVMARGHYARERLTYQLMTALYRCGRTAEALAAFRATRERMVDELGIEPTAPLRELEQAILRSDPALTLNLAAAATSPCLSAGGGA